MRLLPPCLSLHLASLLNVLGVGLGGESYWDLSDIPLSAVIYICFKLRGDFLLIQEKGEEFSVSRPSSARDLFSLVLFRLKTLAEQRQLHSSVDRLRSEG